jgi:hypothetical protein
MITTEIIDNLKETFNITASRSVITRANLSKHNFISRKKNTIHIEDVYYMLYGFILGPGNYRDAKIFYKEMAKNHSFIIQAFSKIYSIGFNNIKNVTFGYWYIIVNCNNQSKNFIVGKNNDHYNGHSVTVTVKKLNDFFCLF